MKRMITVVLTLAMIIGLAGCNTVEGLGKDIKKGGEAIEKAAEKAK